MFTWLSILCFYGKATWKPGIAKIAKGGLTVLRWTPRCKGQYADTQLWFTSIKLNPFWKTEVSINAWIWKYNIQASERLTKVKEKLLTIQFVVFDLSFIFFIAVSQTISVINRSGAFYFLHASN